MSRNLPCIVIFVLCLCYYHAHAQTFTTVYNFCSQPSCSDGQAPTGSLIQGLDGNLYGTTSAGGAFGHGTIFQISPDGQLTTLYSLCSKKNCSDGSGPVGALTLGVGGDLYGVTTYGGSTKVNPGGLGTVFKISAAGALTTLYRFTYADAGVDGAGPTSGLVLGSNGDFYGTTGSYGGDGTIFKMTPAGKLTTVYSFDSTGGTNGLYPNALIQAANGMFYGTTFAGGAYGGATCSFGYDNCGTVFKMTPAGKLTTLYNFNGADGANPLAGLVQTSSGKLYGTTSAGGANGTCPGNEPCGTVFQITARDVLTTLYSFCSQPSCTDGNDPVAALIEATDGNLYGTTGQATPSGPGTIFQITLGGSLTTLYRFGYGGFPFGLVQGTDGKLYGTTFYGGTGTCTQSGGCGTIFSLDLGLRPFVTTSPTSGKVGAVVNILGSNLNGTTSVTFNGTSATVFTVNATSTAISATVPAGATTGIVQVTTPGGTLSSNMAFRVLP